MSPTSATTGSSWKASSTATREIPLNARHSAASNGIFANWPSDITEALNEFYSNYNALQVRYEQRFVARTHPAELLHLGALARQRIGVARRQHSFAAGRQQHPGRTTAQSDYNLPIANVTSLVYELAVRSWTSLRSQTQTGSANAILGGWQVSAINTAQAGTPFNLTYTPNSAQQVSPQISATYRGANEYRPDRCTRPEDHAGHDRIARGQHRLRQLHQLLAPS